MSLDTLGTPPGPSDWNDTLRSLEDALRTGDAEQVTSIAIAVTLGPVPEPLSGRALAVLDGMADLQAHIGARLASIATELDRIPPRTRHGSPPAPSQLDCSA